MLVTYVFSDVFRPHSLVGSVRWVEGAQKQPENSKHGQCNLVFFRQVAAAADDEDHPQVSTQVGGKDLDSQTHHLAQEYPVI